MMGGTTQRWETFAAPHPNCGEPPRLCTPLERLPNTGQTTGNMNMDDASIPVGEIETITQCLVKDLAAIGSVSYAAQFNGFALFEDGVMFGLVDEESTVYLRASLQTGERFSQMGSVKHAELPYWSLPEVLSSDLATLRALAYEAADNAHIAASFGIDDDADARHALASVTPLRTMLTTLTLLVVQPALAA